jgi:hypothetical protein
MRFFLQKVKDLSLEGSHKIFQSQWTNNFETMAHLSGQKGDICRFWVKFQTQLSGQL